MKGSLAYLIIDSIIVFLSFIFSFFNAEIKSSLMILNVIAVIFFLIFSVLLIKDIQKLKEDNKNKDDLDKKKIYFHLNFMIMSICFLLIYNKVFDNEVLAEMFPGLSTRTIYILMVSFIFIVLSIVLWFILQIIFLKPANDTDDVKNVFMKCIMGLLGSIIIISILGFVIDKATTEGIEAFIEKVKAVAFLLVVIVCALAIISVIGVMLFYTIRQLSHIAKDKDNKDANFIYLLYTIVAIFIVVKLMPLDFNKTLDQILDMDTVVHLCMIPIILIMFLILIRVTIDIYKNNFLNKVATEITKLLEALFRIVKNLLYSALGIVSKIPDVCNMFFEIAEEEEDLEFDDNESNKNENKPILEEKGEDNNE